jgi:hypothetical protein
MIAWIAIKIAQVEIKIDLSESGICPSVTRFNADSSIGERLWRSHIPRRKGGAVKSR